MKVGIVGAGASGTACMFALTLRGFARATVLVNRDYERARGAAPLPTCSMEPCSRR